MFLKFLSSSFNEFLGISVSILPIRLMEESGEPVANNSLGNLLIWLFDRLMEDTLIPLKSPSLGLKLFPLSEPISL